AEPRARGRDRADPGRPVRRAPRWAGLGGGAPGRRLLVPGPDPRRAPGRLTTTVILLSGPTHRHGRAWSGASARPQRVVPADLCRAGAAGGGAGGPGEGRRARGRRRAGPRGPGGGS